MEDCFERQCDDEGGVLSGIMRNVLQYSNAHSDNVNKHRCYFIVILLHKISWITWKFFNWRLWNMLEKIDSYLFYFFFLESILPWRQTKSKETFHLDLQLEGSLVGLWCLQKGFSYQRCLRLFYNVLLSGTISLYLQSSKHIIHTVVSFKH